MATENNSEQKNIQHILLSLLSFLIVLFFERVLHSLGMPMWLQGVLALLATVAAYAAYSWGARKWVGPTQPFIWVITLIGVNVVLTLRSGMRPGFLDQTTLLLAMYWKDVVVAYLFEWFATPKSQHYHRRWIFFRLGSVGSILFALMAVNVIVYDTLIAHNKHAPLIGVVIYMLFGGVALLNAHTGIEQERCDQPLGSYYQGATHVYRYIKLTGVPAAEFGVQSYGWVLALGMVYFYGRNFVF